MPSLAVLISRLGILFGDTRLLESALTHSSLLHERPGELHMLASSERLEFLGDSVLNYIAADLVYTRFPERGEGELTALRAALIQTRTLADFAREFDLGSFLRLSKGEANSGARTRDSLLADTFEALLAAIYLDRGMDAVRSFLVPVLERRIAQIIERGLIVDYKSRLQERIQAARNITPLYYVLSVTGPDHQRTFMVEVRIGDEQIGIGHGSSKQAATQDAAFNALAALDTASPPVID